MGTLRLDGNNPEDVLLVARLLREGRVVAIPTETVYGLAADATSQEAVLRIYEAKGRPATNPLIVHVATIDEARPWADWNPTAERAGSAFWPGPLTLVLPNAKGIAPAALAGGSTVGLRVPRHPVAQALLKACRLPLAAPSANRSNALSPTTAAAVLDTLDGRIDAVLDGGPCEVGLESTVLDLSAEPHRVLRPGMIPPAELAAVLGATPGSGAAHDAAPLRSPGMMARHYAPRIPLVIASEVARVAGPDDAVLTFSPVRIESRHREVLPTDPRALASRLYGALREAEHSGAQRIVLERPPADGELWAAIEDRLRRATSTE